jgi:hypothetical protein
VPGTLAAEEAGRTLAGFLRSRSLKVYTGVQRVAV